MNLSGSIELGRAITLQLSLPSMTISKTFFFFLRQLLNGDLDTKSKYLKALIFSSKVPKHLFNQLQIGYLTVLILEAWNSLYNFVQA